MKVAVVMPLATQRSEAELALEDLLHANRCGPQADYLLALLEEEHMADEAGALGYRVRTFAAGLLRQPQRYTRTVLAMAARFRHERV